MFIQENGNFKVKILLVDDRKENLISLQNLLEERDNKIEFLKATSGQEALRVAFFEDPALILLDVQMPEMDGYEVARLLKGNNKTRSIPVIFVTAVDQDINHILEGYETGAIDYLFKPLNPAITKAKVRSFIKMHLQRKELEMVIHLVNNSLDLMCILDEKTLTLKAANPAWESILGYPLDHLKGSPFTNYIACNDDADKDCLLKAFADKNSLLNFETRSITRNNEVKYILWSFIYKEGAWYCNGKEITERKITENQLHLAQQSLVKLNGELEERVKRRTEELRNKNEQLQRTNTDLDNFIYTASHDLKAPISNIEGLMIALEPGCRQNKEAEQLIRMINQSIERFKHTISDLTDMAKAQSEEISDEDTIVFTDMISEVKLLSDELIKRYKPDFIEDYSQAPEIKFSRKNMRSILFNLLTNAIKYCSPGRKPEVKITTYRKDDYTVISMQDNGLGIKEQDKTKVFSMFKRLHDHVEGTGIGMSLVKRIVDNSGGKIELDSKIGEGSIFRIFLKSKDALNEEQREERKKKSGNKSQ